MRVQRWIVDLSPHDWTHFTFAGKIAGYGWLFHYVPFLLMARVCYIHHYLPTLYFAVLMLAHMLDHFLWNVSTARYQSRRQGQGRIALSEITKNVTFVLTLSLIVGVFWWFRETAWGMDGPVYNRWGIKWRKTWNIRD
jgi:dolichyl-phosphate-mannose-protein mannosyltransferase